MSANHVPAAIKEIAQINQWVAYSRTKIPISPRGTPADSTDPETWGSLAEAKWIRKVQGLPGVGFVFSDGDPYIGIDLDNAIDPITDQPRGWAQQIISELDSYTELSPSGLGVHILIKGHIEQRGARRSIDDGKLECYASGRYFTVSGKHLAGTPETIRECPDLQTWWNTQFADQNGSESRSGSHSMPPIAFDAPPIEAWLEDALGMIGADDYHDWIKVGMALQAELGDAGFSYWDRWSARSAKYGGTEACRRKWDSLGDSRVTIASVIWLAEQRGFRMPARPRQTLDVDWNQWLRLQEGVAEPEGADQGLGIRWVNFADAYRDRTPFEPDLVGPGVLGTGDLMLLFGPPKSMKSMVMLDMARQWAQGKDWLGFAPQRPLKIAYTQFEVKADQMRKRLQLAPLSKDELAAIDGNLFYTDRFTPILDADFVLSFAEATLKAFPDGLDVLVIDPIANIYTGDSENDNAQMSRFIRQIKALRNAINPNVAIILIHHANKATREDRHKEPFNAARGGSALRGAYDAGLYLDLVDEGGPLKLWSELRNGPRREPMTIIFDEGRFRTPDSARYEDLDLAPYPTGDPFTEWLCDTLRSEALAGNYYTRSTFADTFAGMGDVAGSAATIKREIDRVLTIGRCGYFLHVDGLALPAPHYRSVGYLCVRDMRFVGDLVDEETGEVIEIDTMVNAEFMKDPHSGRTVQAGFDDIDYSLAIEADERERLA